MKWRKSRQIYRVYLMTSITASLSWTHKCLYILVLFFVCHTLCMNYSIKRKTTATKSVSFQFENGKTLNTSMESGKLSSLFEFYSN